MQNEVNGFLVTLFLTELLRVAKRFLHHQWMSIFYPRFRSLVGCLTSHLKGRTVSHEHIQISVRGRLSKLDCPLG